MSKKTTSTAPGDPPPRPCAHRGGVYRLTRDGELKQIEGVPDPAIAGEARPATRPITTGAEDEKQP